MTDLRAVVQWRRQRTYFFLIILNWDIETGSFYGQWRLPRGASRWEALLEIRAYVEQEWKLAPGGAVAKFILERDRLS